MGGESGGEQKRATTRRGLLGGALAGASAMAAASAGAQSPKTLDNPIPWEKEPIINTQDKFSKEPLEPYLPDTPLVRIDKRARELLDKILTKVPTSHIGSPEDAPVQISFDPKTGTLSSNGPHMSMDWGKSSETMLSITSRIEGIHSEAIFLTYEKDSQLTMRLMIAKNLEGQLTVFDLSEYSSSK